MGWCGLKYPPDLNEIDLGYRFKKESWGKGYATEAAYASIRYGFEKMGCNIQPGGQRSTILPHGKSWKKCGITNAGEEEIEGILIKPTRSGIRPSDK